jgi:hypothetical protein
MICTVSPTVADGYVVRWWRSVEHAEYGYPPVVSASRRGVMVDGLLHEVPDAVMHQARTAWLLLDRGESDHVRAMATHSRGAGYQKGRFIPIEQENSDA